MKKPYRCKACDSEQLLNMEHRPHRRCWYGITYCMDCDAYESCEGTMIPILEDVEIIKKDRAYGPIRHFIGDSR